MPRRSFTNTPIRHLVAALRAGDWVETALVDRAAAACGRRYRFLRPFVRRAVATFPEMPDASRLYEFAVADARLNSSLESVEANVSLRFFPGPGMQPHAAASLWPIPQLPTIQSLGKWLCLDLDALDWFADVTGRTSRSRSLRLRHYRHTWIAKRNGTARLVEAPKEILKQIQRKLLRDLLNFVPPHPAVHGFRRERSALTNAAQHCGRRVVIGLDFAEFFPSIPAGRVWGLFRSIGYPHEVSSVLAGLCTTSTPRDVWDARPNAPVDGSDHSAWLRAADRHLPQGAPTSPALANLVAYRLDCRLAGLAAHFGATYSRYADDLTFSGDAALDAELPRFRAAAISIAAAEGFAVNPRKTRVSRAGSRQRVTGLVVNVRPNVPKSDHDRLKAILTNCVRHGPEGQNRDGVRDFRQHLLGRVAFVGSVNPVRGAKLMSTFDRIVWPSDNPTSSSDQ